MKKYLAMVPKMAERFGWGVVLSSAPYVNGLLVLTAGLACFILCVVFNMFGIQPGPPQDTANPVSWLLYLMVIVCYGWYIWAFMASYLLFPLGAAFSILDLLAGRKNNNAELHRGAVAGICLAAIPIAMWFQYPSMESHFTAAFLPLLKHHGFPF